MKKAIKFLLLVIVPGLCTMQMAVILWLLGLGRIFDLIAFALFSIGLASVYVHGVEI